MQEIITSLRSDHRNIARLLRLLHRQTEHLEQAEYTDYQLLADIMRYFVTCPDIYHHPHEDLIFARLKNRHGEVAELIQRISKEHESIARDGSAILDEVRQLQGNAIFSREKFVAGIRAFISAYRAHMDLEEGILFQSALQHLASEDWQEIGDAIQANDDPLFGTILDREYQDLFKAIMADAPAE